MSDIYEQMMRQHTIVGEDDRRNAQYEVMQPDGEPIILADIHY